MSKKRKHTGLKIALGTIGGIIGANVAGTAYLSASAAKKMKEHEDGNNMMVSVSLGKKKIDIKPDTDRAYINCVSSATEISLDSLPINYDLYIELSAFCSVIAIKLPADVRVSLEGTGSNDVINNLYGDEEDCSLPTVHIVRNNTKFNVINIVKDNSSDKEVAGEADE